MKDTDMYVENIIWAYIDPNTSQHVFSLFGQMLAFLMATGGVVVTGSVLVRHRIVSCFKKVSWPRRLLIMLAVLAALAVITALVCGLIW